MPHSRLLPTVVAAALLAPSGGAALHAAESPPAAAAPRSNAQPLEQAILGALALVHDQAGFSADFATGTFSDGKPDTRAEMALAVRKVPEVIKTALERLDPAARPAADRANEAAKQRLATFAGEHSFRRALAWYEPLLQELAPEMPEPKLTPEQITALRAQLREWQAKAPTYREWARKRRGDPKPVVPAKPPVPPKYSQGEGPFADVPVAHPAYGATQLVARAGLFTGYPENTFSGKRALTRYEFAVALQRVLQDVHRMFSQKRMGDPGIPPRLSRLFPFEENLSHSSRLTSDFIPNPGPPGVIGPPGARPAPAQLPRLFPWLRALLAEFDTELAMLGSDVEQLKRSLDQLEQRVETQMKQPAAPKPQDAAGFSRL